jgi:TRAP-type mannitol/chloroaromatic compound transport system permease small subunit
MKDELKDNKFTQLLTSFTDKLGSKIALGIIAIGGVVSYEVISRFVFNSPTMWAQEVTALMFGVYAILAGAYCLAHERHVRMDIIWGRLSPRGKAIADVVTSGFSFVFIGLLLWYSVPYAWRSVLLLEGSESPFHAPYYPSKIILVLAAFWLLLQLIAKFIHDLRVALNK